MKIVFARLRSSKEIVRASTLEACDIDRVREKHVEMILASVTHGKKSAIRDA